MKTYSDLEIHRLIRYRTHPVIETERILAHIVRGEDEVALPFFLTVDDGLVSRAYYAVVDVEGAAGLYLIMRGLCQSASGLRKADRSGLRRTAK